jgi:hypothetical protein
MWNFLQALFGERSTIVTPECQVNDTNTAPDTKTKDGMMNDKDKNLSDIDRLENKYGELTEGKVIETTLQEILTTVPRHRARTDAYDTLVKKLESDYNVKLIITSRKKNKLNKKQDE